MSVIDPAMASALPHEVGRAIASKLLVLKVIQVEQTLNETLAMIADIVRTTLARGEASK